MLVEAYKNESEVVHTYVYRYVHVQVCVMFNGVIMRRYYLKHDIHVLQNTAFRYSGLDSLLMHAFPILHSLIYIPTMAIHVVLKGEG